MKRIYIASPYSLGDVNENVSIAILFAERLALNGFAPFCPLLNHFWHLAHPHDHDFWLRQDLEWLILADAVLRLPGESKGADIEVRRATELGIPVFKTISQIIEHFKD